MITKGVTNITTYLKAKVTLLSMFNLAFEEFKIIALTLLQNNHRRPSIWSLKHRQISDRIEPHTLIFTSI